VAYEIEILAWLFARDGMDGDGGHSAQFKRPIQTVLPYYQQMLSSFQILP
jgi:hypothetical protein